MSKELLPNNGANSGKGQFLIYEAEDGKVKIDVRMEEETVWLTQQLMADLFQSSQQNISHHIQCIYEEGELTPEATHKKYLSVRREGKREVQRRLDYYIFQGIHAAPCPFNLIGQHFNLPFHFSNFNH